jgi:hypothetical protein
LCLGKNEISTFRTTEARTIAYILEELPTKVTRRKMKSRPTSLISAITVSVSAFLLASALTAVAAQNPQMAQKVEEIKQASAANKGALARYTWQEKQTISLKGEIKKTVSYQVSVGPDGQQQKIELGSSSAPPPSGGRIKQRIVAKKKNEFQEYGQQVAALAKQYTQPDPQLLQQAYQQGNTSIQLGGAPGTVTLAIKNYLKPGDSMTLVFSESQKTIQTLQIASYLSDPKDAVTIAVQFARLPDGVNHVATAQINGVSKQMTVAIQNFNYQLSQM